MDSLHLGTLMDCAPGQCNGSITYIQDYFLSDTELIVKFSSKCTGYCPMGTGGGGGKPIEVKIPEHADKKGFEKFIIFYITSMIKVGKSPYSHNPLWGHAFIGILEVLHKAYIDITQDTCKVIRDELLHETEDCKKIFHEKEELKEAYKDEIEQLQIEIKRLTELNKLYNSSISSFSSSNSESNEYKERVKAHNSSISSFSSSNAESNEYKERVKAHRMEQEAYKKENSNRYNKPSVSVKHKPALNRYKWMKTLRNRSNALKARRLAQSKTSLKKNNSTEYKLAHPKNWIWKEWLKGRKGNS